jgi:hypothetical protein
VFQSWNEILSHFSLILEVFDPLLTCEESLAMSQIQLRGREETKWRFVSIVQSCLLPQRKVLPWRHTQEKISSEGMGSRCCHVVPQAHGPGCCSHQQMTAQLLLPILQPPTVGSQELKIEAWGVMGNDYGLSSPFFKLNSSNSVSNFS